MELHSCRPNVLTPSHTQISRPWSFEGWAWTCHSSASVWQVLGRQECATMPVPCWPFIHIYLFVYLDTYGPVCHVLCVEVGDNFQKAVLSSHHVVAGDWTWVARRGGKRLSVLSSALACCSCSACHLRSFASLCYLYYLFILLEYSMCKLEWSFRSLRRMLWCSAYDSQWLHTSRQKGISSNSFMKGSACPLHFSPSLVLA